MMGLACRIMLYSSLILGAVNEINIELSTPELVAPDSMLLCFNGTNVGTTTGSGTLLSIAEGGDIFNTTEKQLIQSNGSLQSSPFFAADADRPLSQQVPPVWHGSLSSFLALDPYYNRSYKASWLDDVQFNEPTARLPGIIGARSCMAVTGRWESGTRYEVRVQVNNPSPSSDGGSVPFATAVWVAPLTYSGRTSLGSSGQQQLPQLAVRGSKYGSLCLARPALAAAASHMLDACFEASALGLVPSEQTNIQACTDALQAAAGSTFLPSSPPFAASSIVSLAQSSCPAGQLLALRYQECVDCTGADASAGPACTCSNALRAATIGQQACRPAYGPSGQASSLQELAQQLCTAHSSLYQQMVSGGLSDRAAHRLLLPSFLRGAAQLLDWEDLRAANQSFWSSYVADHRRPDSPSRRHGILPNCNRCFDGAFRDQYTGQLQQAYDDRFQAVQAFRLVGFALHRRGFPCATLWDEQEPLRDMYGGYDQTICADLPNR